MSRGGRRQGSPGQSYSNRSDLNQNYAPTAPPNLSPTTPPPPQSGPQSALPTQTAAAPAGPPIPPPGMLGTHLPSQRPGEPITHGLPSGPGAGPEALPQMPFQPDPLVQLSAAISAVPAVHQTPIMRALAAATNASVSNASLPGVAPGGQQ